MKNKGWVVRMKKKMIKSAKKDKGISEYRNSIDKNEKYTNFFAYGDFDYLQFVPINSWNEYHENFLKSDWVAPRQTVMLFQIDNPESNVEMESYLLKNEKNAEKGCFHVLTMLHLSNEMKDTGMEFRQVLVNIKKAILNFIAIYPKKKNDLLECDVYGTFSSSEIAIIWSVSQYADVIDILDYMRYFYCEDNKKKKRVFIASYTIVAWNKNYKGSKKIRGSVLTQIEFLSASNIPGKRTDQDTTPFFIQEDIKEKLKKELGLSSSSEVNVMSSVGKSDFIVQFSAECIQKKSKVRKLIESKTMTLMRGEENKNWLDKVRENKARLQVEIECFPKGSKKLDSKLNEHWNMYKSISEKIQPYDLRFEFRELVLLMFNDYKRVISSSVDQKWLADYEEQFGTILNLINTDVNKIVERIKEIKEEDRKCRLDLMEKLSQQCAVIVDIMQQQVDHILESSKLFFTSPNSSIGYTAQFDLMLHMYYGIIKSLISNAYDFRKSSWQYSLVPVVTFMSTPEIGSTMVYAADNSLNAGRLIQFRFPCDAWANPIFYLPYLIHEVYHYITPYDRVHRNESFLVIVLSEICINYFEKISEIMENKYGLVDSKRYSTELKSLIKCQLYLHIASEADTLLLLVERNSSYRNTTFQFKEDQLSDMPIYQMQEAFFIWLNREEMDCNIRFCRWIQEMIAKIKKNHTEFGVKKEQMEFLKEIDKVIDQANKEKKFLSIKAQSIKIVNNLFHYLREIYPDCAMIQHLEMDVSEYLVQVAVQLSNKLVMPSKITHETAPEWIRMGTIRIAPIIEYFRKEHKLEDYKSSFCILYANTLSTIHVPSMESNSVEESKKLAEDWFSFFQKCYDEYKDGYSIYKIELKNQIDNYLKNMKPVKSLYDLYKEYRELICKKVEEAGLESVQQKLFDLSLELVLKMQNQVSIFKMNQKLLSPKNKKRKVFVAKTVKKIEMRPKCKDPVTYILQGGFGGLMDIMHNIVSKLDEYHYDRFGCHLGHEDLWYRGISDERYNILPSLYRKYAEENNHVKYEETGNTNISLEQVQHHLLQRFRYQADGAPEIINQAVYRNSDYLALMQHYQLPTNLLDWSEDVFAAIYFALEGYFKEEDNEKKKGKDDEKKKENNSKKTSPAVYFFDPEAYNKARKEIIEEVCSKCEKVTECEAYKRQQTLMEEYLELVPNVSVQINEENMKEYFCIEYVGKKKKGIVHTGSKSKDLSNYSSTDNCELCKLPVAYYCSRLSPRIRAQSGQFVAFSLDIGPRRKEDEEYLDGNIPSTDEERLSFDYMALNKVQDYYLDIKEDGQPFMLKLVIPQRDCESLAKLLRKFGIKTIKYYPELTNLKN